MVLMCGGWNLGHSTPIPNGNASGRRQGSRHLWEIDIDDSLVYLRAMKMGQESLVSVGMWGAEDDSILI
jgi:hypothetical protein